MKKDTTSKSPKGTHSASFIMGTLASVCRFFYTPPVPREELQQTWDRADDAIKRADKMIEKDNEFFHEADELIEASRRVVKEALAKPGNSSS